MRVSFLYYSAACGMPLQKLLVPTGSETFIYSTFYSRGLNFKMYLIHTVSTRSSSIAFRPSLLLPRCTIHPRQLPWMVQRGRSSDGLNAKEENRVDTVCSKYFKN